MQLYWVMTFSFHETLFSVECGGLCWWKTSDVWNWFSSPTRRSRWEFILLVSMKGLSLHNSFLSKHFISENVCSFFLCTRRPCRSTTSESDGATEKWLPPWRTMKKHLNLFLSKSSTTSGHGVVLFSNYDNDWFASHHALAERMPRIEMADRNLRLYSTVRHYSNLAFHLFYINIASSSLFNRKLHKAFVLWNPL